MTSDDVGLLMQCGHVIVFPCRRGAFATNRNDNMMTYALAAYGEYGEDEFEALANVIKPGDVVLDVGANIGTHSVAFASMVGNDGAVISFEPTLCTFNLLCANIAFSGRQNIYPRRAIVGSENAERTLPQVDHKQTANYGSINAKKMALGAAGGIPVPEMSIDAMQLSACNLIKIDVEGNELDVLDGAKATIAKHRPNLFVECNDTTDPTELLKFFHAREYKTYWVYNRYFRPNNFKGSTDAKEGRDRNILAVRDAALAKGLTPCSQ